MRSLLIILTITAISAATSSCTTVTEIDQKTKITTEVTRFMGITMKTKAISSRPKY